MVKPRSQRLDELRALATERRWLQIRGLLEGPAYWSLAVDVSSLFEEIGDEYAAANDWEDALRCYHFGMWHAAKRPGRNPQPALNAIHLLGKFADALRWVAGHESGFREATANEVVALALTDRTDPAEEMLGWLNSLKDADGAGCSTCGAKFEQAADEVRTGKPEAAHWLYRKAGEQYRRHAAGEPKASRLHEKLDRIAHPAAPEEPAQITAIRLPQVGEEPAAITEDLKQVEALAIAERFRDAAALLNQILSPRTNAEERSMAAAGYLAEIAGRLADMHPKAARKLYENVLDEYRSFASSANTAHEGRERWAMADEIAYRISRLVD